MTMGLITVTLLALLLTGAQQRSDPEAQMQAALHEEMVAGNPAGAIELYKSILAQGGISRTVAATALLHIGECEQRLGRKEDARKSFLRVIRQFGDQGGIAVQAR